MQKSEGLNTDIGILTCYISHIYNRVVKLQARGPHMVSGRFLCGPWTLNTRIAATLRRLHYIRWAYDTVIRSVMKTETYVLTKRWYPLVRLKVDFARKTKMWILCPAHICFFLSLFFFFPAWVSNKTHWITWVSSLYRITSKEQQSVLNMDISNCIHLTTCMFLLRPATLKFIFTLSPDISYGLLWNMILWNLIQAQEYGCHLFLPVI